jgi:hypothetical protein
LEDADFSQATSPSGHFNKRRVIFSNLSPSGTFASKLSTEQPERSTRDQTSQKPTDQHEISHQAVISANRSPGKPQPSSKQHLSKRAPKLASEFFNGLLQSNVFATLSGARILLQLPTWNSKAPRL